MSLSAAVVRELVAAGLAGDALVAACERIEVAHAASALDARPLRSSDEQANRRREADRNRKRAARLRNSADSADSSDIPPPSQGSSEVSPEPPSYQTPNPSPKKDPKGSPKRGFGPGEKILVDGIGQKLAAIVIDHRKAKKAPITDRAAEILVKGFLATGDPAGAVDLMVSRNWTGFELDWWQNERNRRNPGRASGEGFAPADGASSRGRRAEPVGEIAGFARVRDMYREQEALSGERSLCVDPNGDTFAFGDNA